MYKLIAIDMDGTLLNKEGKISKKNRQAINKATENGVKVVITTGRSFSGIERFLDELGLNKQGEYALVCNGGAAYNCYTREVITSVGLKGKDLHIINEINKGLNLKIQAYTLDLCFANEENKFTKFEREHIGSKIEIIDFCKDIKEDDDIMKVLLLEEPEILDEKIKMLPEEIKERYALVKSLPMTLEIMNKECNKGFGLEKLIKELGVKREEVVSIGDEQNDFEMIKFAGLGVAMGNASEKIKEIADYITKTNEEDGVAHVIEKFVLN
ncbi:Cof-type HAD-IIB family hydrolase [Clostridium mediterraneense]|uniref:Cof-type HAD-IIB family hydrolase n=1 Tax=Clostridium mediterraneense TaxID=1805472 RepID=UPI000829A9A8|nr:Cof-type HAD-IIB family hydrolase [Clostridium mediterraneense]